MNSWQLAVQRKQKAESRKRKAVGSLQKEESSKQRAENWFSSAKPGRDFIRKIRLL